jgi:TP901 family phage tail tape measure protein
MYMATSGRPLGSMIVSLGMDGSKFEDSLKSIQNQFKLAKNEMKANLASLSDTSSAYDKASTKVDSLTKVIDVNERQIKSLTSTYAAQVKVNGEFSDTAMKTASKIDALERQQSNYRNELERSKQAMNEASSGLASYRSAIDRVQREIQASVSAFKANDNAVQANRSEYQKLGTELKAYGNLISAEKSKLANLTRTRGLDSDATKEQATRISELESRQTVAKARYDELGKSVSGLTSNQAKAMDGMSKFSKTASTTGDNIKSAGQSMSGFSLATGAAFIYGAKQATEFQNRMNEIKNLIVTGGESTKDAVNGVSVMTKDAQKYSEKYGKSVQDISAGYENLVKRGYNSKQAIGAMKSELQASVASGDDFNDVVNVASSTLESFRLNVDKSGKQITNTAQMTKNTKTVVNDLAFAADKTSTGFKDLGIGMSYVGSTAHQAGLSLSETSSAMGILSNNGLEADKAGTGLRKTINSLTSPTAAAAKALQGVGLSTADFVDKSGKMKSMTDIFGELQDHTSEMNKTDKTDLFHTIFGTTGQTAALVLANSSKQLGELNKQVEASSKNNYVGSLSAKNMKSAQNQLAIFKQTVTNLAMSFAETLLPAITRVAAKVSEFLQKINDLSPGMKKIVSYGALIAAALGPALIIIGAVIKSIGTIGIAIKTSFEWVTSTLIPWLTDGGIVTFMTNPITIAIAAIVAVGVALVEAYKHVAPFRDAVNDLAAKIKSAFDKVKSVITDVFTLLTNGPESSKSESATMDLAGILPQDKVTALLNNINTIRSAFTKFSTDVKNALSKVKSVVSDVFALLTNGPQSGKSEAATFDLSSILPADKLNAVLSGVNRMRTAFKNLRITISGIGSVAKGLWDALTGQGRQATDILSKFFPKATVVWITVTVGTIGSLVGRVVNSIKATFSSLWTTVSPIVSKIGSGFLEMVQNIVKWWNQYGGQLLAAFRNIFSLILAIVSPIITAIVAVVSSGIRLMLATVRGLLDVIRNVFSSVWGNIKEIVRGALEIIKGILEVFAGIFTGNWRTLWQGVKDIFKGIWDGLQGIVKGAMNAVVGVVNAGIDGVNAVIHTFGGKAKAIGHIPHLEKGTGGHEGGPALVNDARGSNYKELVVLPNSEAFIPQDRNVLIPDLPRGAQVLNANQTKFYMNSLGIKRYENGTVSNILGAVTDTASDASKWVGDKVSGVANWIGDKTKTIEKYLKDPLSALSNIWDHFTSGLSVSGEFAKNFALGAGHYIVTQAVDWFKDIIKKAKDDLEDAGGGKGAPSGSGVQRWKGQVKDALKANGLSTSESMVNKVLRQINTESGGNQRAVGGNDGLADGNATGLMQTKPGTFRANAFPGHGDIMNGYDNLLAALHYAKKRYGSSLSFLGQGHGYANGGVVFSEQIASVAEGNKPEAIIPLDPAKRPRAMQLLAQVKQIVGDNNNSQGRLVVNGNNSKLEATSNQQNKLLQTQNQLLSQILSAVLSGGSGSNTLSKLTDMINDTNLGKRRINDLTVS